MNGLKKVLDGVRYIFKFPIMILNLIPGMGKIGEKLSGYKTIIVSVFLVALGVWDSILDSGVLSDACNSGIGFLCAEGSLMIALGLIMGMMREVTNKPAGGDG